MPWTWRTRASVSPPNPPPMIVIGVFTMIPSGFEVATYFPSNYGTSFHYYGMTFHLCQDEVWFKKHAARRRVAVNDEKNRSHGSKSLKRRSSFWMAAEKAGLRFAPCPNGSP